MQVHFMRGYHFHQQSKDEGGHFKLRRPDHVLISSHNIFLSLNRYRFTSRCSPAVHNNMLYSSMLPPSIYRGKPVERNSRGGAIGEFMQ